MSADKCNIKVTYLNMCEHGVFIITYCTRYRTKLNKFNVRSFKIILINEIQYRTRYDAE